MKKLIFSIIAILGLIGCQEDNQIDLEPSEVQFGIVFENTSNSGGRTSATLTPSRIQVTVEDDNGDIVLDSEIIDLIVFGNSFTSGPISLLPGTYRLTSFLVLNQGDTAVFAAPQESSPLAQLVNNPLLIEFGVAQDEATNVEVEVIQIDDTDPSEFGYVSFIPIFIPTFQFEIVVFEADTMSGNIQTTQADLTITSNNDTLRNLSLSTGANLITVNDDLESYTLLIIKEGFETFSQTYTPDDIKSFTAGNLLEVILVPTGNPIETGLFINSGQEISTEGATGIALGDLDGDGDIDVIITVQSNAGNTIWLNDGNGFFTESSQRLGSRFSQDIAIEDFDNDGDLDVFVINLATSGNTLWLNDGSGNFSDSGQRIGSQSGLSISTGDIDLDGDIDAFITNANSNYALWLNNGQGIFNNAITFPSGSTNFNTFRGLGSEMKDLDGDGDLDIVVTATGGPSQIFFNDGMGRPENTTFLTSGRFRTLLADDFDNDSDIDIVFLIGGNLANEIFLNDGSGVFTSRTFNTTSTFNGASTGDFDNDGDIDLIIASILPDGVQLLINDGNALFSEGTLVDTDPSPSGVAVADLNGDGILDAFVVNIAGGSNSSVFFGKP